MKLSLTSFLLFAIVVITIIAGVSCSKDQFINPFDDPKYDPPEATSDLATIDPDNFAYLHANIFAPTCANSGCHDGTFEPDFRTIYGSYNSLVYQSPIKTVLDGQTFDYRVKPGESGNSALYKRLTYDDTTAEQMPLLASGDPFLEWKGREFEFISAIKNWIDNGAKDMFGNAPSPGNQKPWVTGVTGFSTGQTSSPLNRASSLSPIEVPAGATSVDIWFSILDDVTPGGSFSYNICSASTNIDDTTGSKKSSIVYSPGNVTANDFSNQQTNFDFKTTVDLTGYQANDHIYIRIYIDDNSQGAPTEIPKSNSSERIVSAFSLKISP